VSGETDPITDDEILYRRVPASAECGRFDKDTGLLSPESFDPHKSQDITGLSIVRAKFKTIEEAAKGRPGKSYFIAVLRAGELRQRGIRVVSKPDLPDGTFDAAHAELPDLNSSTRKSSQTLEFKILLARELTKSVEGPFPTSDA
jgi:hypothetical protein